MNELIRQMMSLYPAKLDEDIPDNDKEAAYKLGYNDAILDVIDICLEVRRQEDSLKKFNAWEGE